MPARPTWDADRWLCFLVELLIDGSAPWPRFDALGAMIALKPDPVLLRSYGEYTGPESGS
jgi:hypothetical protein